MRLKYYLDTSIWLDFLENRNIPGFLKGHIAEKILIKITITNSIIIFSDLIMKEMLHNDYKFHDINNILKKLKKIILLVETTEKQIKRAKDLGKKRNIPKNDCLHALIARDNDSILVTYDKHFNQIKDIIKPVNPKDIIKD